MTTRMPDESACQRGWCLTDGRTARDGGQLSIIDSQDYRALMLNDYVQGGLFAVAAVSEEAGSDAQLSSVPIASYQNLALAIGVAHGNQHGLALGLGCGSGIIALLQAWPQMRFTVIEYDQHVIDLALNHFAALRTLIEDERLVIINEDAMCFVNSHGTSFDFIYSDVSDVRGQAACINSRYITTLARVGCPVWMHIVEAAYPQANHILSCYHDHIVSIPCHQQVEHLLDHVIADHCEDGCRIITTASLDVTQLKAYVPYPSGVGPYIAAIRRLWCDLRVTKHQLSQKPAL